MMGKFTNNNNKNSKNIEIISIDTSDNLERPKVRMQRMPYMYDSFIVPRVQKVC